MARWQGNAIEQPPPGQDPEELALARLQSQKIGSEIEEHDLAIRRAVLRRSIYAARGLERDVQIQNDIIDRRLRERMESMRKRGSA